MDPEKFFLENLRLIADARTDPMGWNLNNGLRALAQQNAALQQALKRLSAQVDALAQEVQTLRIR